MSNTKIKILSSIATVGLLSSPAFSASIDVGSVVTDSVTQIITATVTLLISVIVGWVAIVIKNKFNIDIEAAQRDALTTFLQRQASSLIADGAVKLNGIKVEVKSEALAAASNAAIQAIPGVLKFFDLTPDRVSHMIVDMLPKQPAVAQAAAIAIDVQNPGTPSSNTVSA